MRAFGLHLNRYKHRLAITGAIVVAALFTFPSLNQYSFWGDEVSSVLFAQLSWPELWTIISQREANMALYYIVLKEWLIFGTSEIAVRTLSAIFALASIPAMYGLAKRLFDGRVGIIAAYLFAMNAFFILYAQEARGYSLLLLLVTLSSYFFVRALTESSRQLWIGYAVVSTLAMYVHFFALLVLVAHAASLAFRARETLPWRNISMSALLIVLLNLPLLFFILTRYDVQLGWIPKPTLKDIYYLIHELTGSGGELLLLAYFFPCVVAALYTIRALLWEPQETWRHMMPALWLLAPILIIFAVSMHKPLFQSRYLIICLPPLVLFAAIGLSHIKTKWVHTAALTLIALLSIRSVFALQDRNDVDDWRSATHFLMNSAQPHDAILFYAPHIVKNFEYYRLQMKDHAGVLNYVYPDMKRTHLLAGTFAQPPEDLIPSLARQYERVWLVLSQDQIPQLGRDSRPLESQLNQTYHSKQEQQFQGGIRVLLYVH